MCDYGGLRHGAGRRRVAALSRCGSAPVSQVGPRCQVVRLVRRGSLPGWAATVSWRSASSRAWRPGTGMPGRGCCTRPWSTRYRSHGSVSGGVTATCGSIRSIPVTGTCGRRSRLRTTGTGWCGSSGGRGRHGNRKPSVPADGRDRDRDNERNRPRNVAAAYKTHSRTYLTASLPFACLPSADIGSDLPRSR